MIDRDTAAYRRFMRELMRERYAPLMPPPTKPQPVARQTAIPEPPAPEQHPTGTGWPE